MRNLRKKILSVLLIVFLLIQFIRPEKNNGIAESGKDYTRFVTVPDTVKNIFRTSCYDCHSNKTTYPWYSEVAPLSWWLANHIKDGKAELNFSDFSQYSDRRIKNKLSAIAEQVEKKEMPLKSYLLIHTGTKLSGTQVEIIRTWVDSTKTKLDSRSGSGSPQ